MSAAIANIEIADPRDAMLECRRCEALLRCRSRVVPGHGAIPAIVMFVGIAPGRFGGDRTGVPFSGDRSGMLLRAMIDRAQLGGVFITNIVRCSPRDSRGRNRDPDANEIANCRDHLESEIAFARPRIIACLGRLPWKSLAGRVDFDPSRPSLRGFRDSILYPMYHPGYVIRGAYSARRYANDFARLRAFAEPR
jgi:uracil-DNA glycosylase